MNPALASTVKLLKTVQSLRFANRRKLAITADVAWLAKSKLTPTDRKQLVAILAAYGTKPPITLERALVTAPNDLVAATPGVAGLEAFATCAVEGFDVLDQVDVVQFQLWLHSGNQGVLLRAATTTAVAPITRSAFHGAEHGLDEATAERLAALLRKAKKIAANLHPDSSLASVAF